MSSSKFIVHTESLNGEVQFYKGNGYWSADKQDAKEFTRLGAKRIYTQLCRFLGHEFNQVSWGGKDSI